MSLEALRGIQAGIEAAAAQGVAVPSTKKWIGTMTLTPDITFHRPVDERQSLAEFRRSVKIAQKGALRYESDVTFEQIIDFLGMAVRGSVDSAAIVGGTTSREWVYKPNLTSRNDQDSWTVEYGDNSQVWEAKYVICNSIELSLAMDETVKLTADLASNLPVKSAFTGGISDPDVTEVTTNSCSVFIDNTWATLGTTKKADLVAGGTVRLVTGIMPRQRLDGSFDFARTAEQRRHLEIDLDFIANSDGVVEFDAWEAQTDRAVRLELVGPLIETGINYSLIIDAFGRYTTSPNLYDSADGENTFRLSLSSHQDTTVNEFAFTVRNMETSH